MNEPGGNNPELKKAAGRFAAAGACPAVERIAAFYAGLGDRGAEEALREHLAACPSCLETARDCREFLEAMQPPGRVSGRRFAARGRLFQAGLASAAALLLIVSAVWYQGRQGERTPATPGWSMAVEIPPAGYDPEPSPDAGVAFREEESPLNLDAAMTAYRAGDFKRAETDLENYVLRRAGDERGRFYLGVCRLLNGRTADAARELDQVARTAPEPLRSEARFYLALALLREGDARRAESILKELAAGEGPQRAAASRLLERRRAPEQR